MRRFNAHLATGTANGVTAGSAVNGNPVFLGKGERKVSDLSALVVVDIETSTITMTAKWQVSDDKSTWYDVANTPANDAATVLGTGTGGADATISKVIPAPACVHSYKHARLALVIGVTTGTTNDTYEIGYTYRVPQGPSRRD